MSAIKGGLKVLDELDDAISGIGKSRKATGPAAHAPSPQQFVAKEQPDELRGFADEIEEIDLGDTPLPEGSFADPMDEQAAINSLMDDLDGVGAPPEIQKVEIDEHIDLDNEFIGEKNQNAPSNIFETGAADQVEWVQDLGDEEVKALNVMAHVRGPSFPNIIRDRVIKNNYDRDANLEYPARAVVEQMSDMDLASINFYTRSGDSIMNDTLRAGTLEQGSEIEAAIKATDGALDRLPAWDPADGKLYRSLSENANKQHSNLQPGDVIGDKGYTSTTRDQQFDEATGEFKFSGTPAPAYFVITPKKGGAGRAIEGLSDWGRQEAEVLYKRDTQFKFIRKEQKETEVEMFRSPNETRTTTIYFLEEI